MPPPSPARDAVPARDTPAGPAGFRAVVAAVTDEKIARGRARGIPPRESLTRGDVEALRVAGCTRDEARDYFQSVFGAQRVRHSVDGEVEYVPLVDHLMSDLDSYGRWEGDPEDDARDDAPSPDPSDPSEIPDP